MGEGVLTTRHGVVWVSAPEGNAAFLDTGEPAGDGPGFIPATIDSWIRLFRPSPLTVTSSAALDADGLLFAALAEFHRLALSAEELNRRLMLVDMSNLQRAQALHRRRSEESAATNLFGVLAPPPPFHAGDDGSGPAERPRDDRPPRGDPVPLSTPPQGNGGRGSPIWRRSSACRGSARARSGSPPTTGGGSATVGRCWRSAAGPRKDPVALVPGASGRYRMIDPETGRSERVDARLARTLASEAYFFYRPLPAGRSDPLRRPVSFRIPRARDRSCALHRGRAAGRPPDAGASDPARCAREPRDPERIRPAIAGAVPVPDPAGGSRRHLADPPGNGPDAAGGPGRRPGRRGALGPDARDLPQRFFRSFSSGDLAMRAMALQGLRDQVSGVVGGAVLSVIFLLPTFVLLFLYDTGIGWLGLALGLFSLGLTTVIGLLQLPHYRRLFAISRRLAGKLLQLLNGVSKLRSTGSEGIGFAMWAKDYREQKQTEMRLGMLDEHLLAFLAAAPLLVAAAVFTIAMDDGGATLPTGDFLTVFAALMVFHAANRPARRLVLRRRRHRARLRAGGPDPGGHAGNRLRRRAGRRSSAATSTSTTRASATPRTVPSSCGTSRSTPARASSWPSSGNQGRARAPLFRLALGLETPLSGAVYYDGRDLGRLNRAGGAEPNRHGGAGCVDAPRDRTGEHRRAVRRPHRGGCLAGRPPRGHRRRHRRHADGDAYGGRRQLVGVLRRADSSGSCWPRRWSGTPASCSWTRPPTGWTTGARRR